MTLLQGIVAITNCLSATQERAYSGVEEIIVVRSGVDCKGTDCHCILAVVT